MRGDTAPPVTRILVPTDFSPGSEAALSLAQRLARALGADLVLLHVLDRTPLDVETKVRHEEHEAQRRAQAAGHQLGVLREDQIEPTKKPGHVFRSPFSRAVLTEFSEPGRAWAALLQQWAERARATGSNVTAVLRVGEPSAEILETVQEDRADLVVLSTRGRGNVPRLLLGSITDKVVRMASCPVLTVREPSAD